MKKALQSFAVAALALSFMAACDRATSDASAIQTQTPAKNASLGFQALNVGTKVQESGAVEPNTLFLPTDEIVASVITRDAAEDVPVEVRLVALANGSVRAKVSEQVSTQGRAETNLTFKKDGPWPVGRYQVEATLAGKLEASQPIEVRADLPPELLKMRK